MKIKDPKGTTILILLLLICFGFFISVQLKANYVENITPCFTGIAIKNCEEFSYKGFDDFEFVSVNYKYGMTNPFKIHNVNLVYGCNERGTSALDDDKSKPWPFEFTQKEKEICST